MSLLQTLSTFVERDSDVMTSLVTWLDTLCARDDVTRPPSDAFVKHLLGFLCDVTAQRGNVAARLTDLARDVHVTLGDIDPEVTLDRGDATFALLTSESGVRVAFPVLLARLDAELSDVDALLSERRGVMTSQGGGDADVTSEDAREKAVCGKVGHCINALHEVTQCAVAQSSSCERVIKTLTRVYSLLTTLARQVRVLSC